VAALAPDASAAPSDAGAGQVQVAASDASASPDGGAPSVASAVPQASDSEIGAARPSKPAPVIPQGDVDEPQGEDSDAEVSGRRPGTGLSMALGFGFGGADFVKATSSNGNEQTLSAGQGFIVGLGAMVTPLWPTQGLGFGLGVDGSWKYDSIDADNGSASIRRFPVAFTAHLLTNGSGGGPHYFLLKGGVTKDFGVNYSASGFASLNADVKGTWGPTFALGYYNRTNDAFAWDVLGFFSLTDHVVGTAHLNANTFGLTMAAHLNF
jgi:hypothetical protein